VVIFLLIINFSQSQNIETKRHYANCSVTQLQAKQNKNHKHHLIKKIKVQTISEQKQSQLIKQLYKKIES